MGGHRHHPRGGRGGGGEPGGGSAGNASEVFAALLTGDGAFMSLPAELEAQIEHAVDGVREPPPSVRAWDADVRGRCVLARPDHGWTFFVRDAALVIADSRDQCLAFGECASALRDGAVSASAVRELGECLRDGVQRCAPGRSIVVDLTGVAVQDVVIASLVLDAMKGGFDGCVPLEGGLDGCVPLGVAEATSGCTRG